MSCNCNDTTINGLFACVCDDLVFPRPLDITAGLASLPRQIGTFADFRRDMLYTVPSKAPFYLWNPRDEGDLGVMMLEMWACICDSISFYDQVIAQEDYVGTAIQRSSLRKLIGLLGYLPAPAVASTALLAANADGRLPITLPAGTTFRSGAFNGNPPQTFQLTDQTQIDPLANQWSIIPPHPGLVTANNNFLLVSPQVTLRPGALLLLTDTADNTNNQTLLVSQAAAFTGADGNIYTKITLAAAYDLPAGTPLSRLRLWQPQSTANITALPAAAPAYSILTLDSVYRQLRSLDFVVVDGALNPGRDDRWFQLSAVTETTITGTATNVTINGSSFSVNPPSVPATQLTLDAGLNDSSRKSSGAGDWTDPSANRLVLYYNFVPVSTVTDEALTSLSTGDPLQLAGPLEIPTEQQPPSTLLLRDKNTNGAQLNVSIDFTTGNVTPGQGESLPSPLLLPVTAFGNTLSINRGDQVNGEILGSGDATQVNMTFSLQKSPLTYLPAPTADNDQGVADTLSIYINGIEWSETPSFYNCGPQDQVYTVRQNDQGQSIVSFGDGIQGARVPTGTNNILANYQYGAGAASPPAGAITQIGTPVKGLRSVLNVLAAGGGADAQSAGKMRTYGPASALILGRAVSILDMQAVAAAYPGVRAVQAEWSWQEIRQRPVVQIWYIGAASLDTALSQRLHSLSDPTTPIDVETAASLPTTLSLDVEIDPRYMENDVLTRLRTHLTDPAAGILAPEQIGIGQPLFRSALFAAVLAVPGALSVTGIQWNTQPFDVFAIAGIAGSYYDFENGTLLLNGKPC